MIRTDDMAATEVRIRWKDWLTQIQTEQREKNMRKTINGKEYKVEMQQGYAILRKKIDDIWSGTAAWWATDAHQSDAEVLEYYAKEGAKLLKNYNYKKKKKKEIQTRIDNVQQELKKAQQELKDL